MFIHGIEDVDVQRKLAELRYAVPSHVYIPYLIRFSDAGAAELITVLHLRPYSDAFPPRPEKRSWVALRKHSPNVHLKKARQGLGNLRCLKNLEHLEIHCHLNDDIDAFKCILPSLRSTWPSYSTSLRSLSLKIPLECYQGLFTPSLCIPRLSRLTFHIFASHHSTNPVEPMCSQLVPFINRHVSTLESLAVITPETGTADLSPMFFNLRYFPRLTTLHLTFCALSLEYINLTGIQEFLASHSRQLEDVSLQFHRMVGLKAESFRADIFFALPVFCVPLFALRSLEIGLTGFRDATGLGTLSYVHRFQETLRQLVLSNISLSITTLQRLTAPMDLLRSLDITVQHFTPVLLDELSAHLPELVELRVSFVSYSGAEGSYVQVDVSNKLRLLVFTMLI